MSRLKPREPESAQTAYSCGWCGAPPWQWCLTRTGRFSRYLHSNRHFAWIRDGKPGGAA